MIDEKLFDPALFEARAAKAAGLLKAMANEQRLMLLCRLGSTERSVTRLREDFSLSQSALSQHLAVLRQQGLVSTRRDGQLIYYRLADPAAARIIETLAAIYCPEMFE